eukprot:UN12667
MKSEFKQDIFKQDIFKQDIFKQDIFKQKMYKFYTNLVVAVVHVALLSSHSKKCIM